MKFSIGKITLMSDMEDFNLEYIQDRINSAIDFLKGVIDVERNNLDLNIIIAENYQKMICNYIEGYTPSIHENACLINRFSIRKKTEEKKMYLL